VCNGEDIQRDTIVSLFQSRACIGQAITSLVGISIPVVAMRLWKASQRGRSWSQLALDRMPCSTGSR
jgi:hypothetical protein